MVSFLIYDSPSYSCHSFQTYPLDAPMTLAKKLRDVKTGSTESRGGVASFRLDRVPESWIGVSFWILKRRVLDS